VKFKVGDMVAHRHGRVTWHGIVHAIQDDGIVRVEWGTGVRERMKPEELEPDQCEFQVPIKPWYIRTYQCMRNAKVVVGGGRYCTQHSRMVVKERQ